MLTRIAPAIYVKILLECHFTKTTAVLQNILFDFFFFILFKNYRFWDKICPQPGLEKLQKQKDFEKKNF